MYELATPTPRALVGTVLVVFEDAEIRGLIAVHLRHAGFFPVVAASAREGRRLLAEVRPDAVVVDIDTPATADASFVSAAPGSDPAHRLVTLVITADPDRFCGLDHRACGATVCVGKPFSPSDLLAQLDKHLRPAQAGPSLRTVRTLLHAGPLELDIDRHVATVHRGGRAHAMDLSPTELKVLRNFMEHPQRAHTREQILAAVWGTEHGLHLRTVDQCVKRLRRALDEVRLGALLQTVRGLGYRFDASQAQAGAASR